MSGFGIRALKKIKEEDTAKGRRLYYKYIVLGENVASILTFYQLHKKFPGEVRLITKNPYLMDDFYTELDCTLGSIRSTEVASKLTEFNSHLEIFTENRDVYFYKDAKFHKFGGRARAHDLSELESFFQNDSYHLKLDPLLDNKEVEELDELLKEFQINKIIEKIEVVEPKDLVEVSHFKLQTGEHESFECEKLFYTHSPKAFFSKVINKDDLSDSLGAFCAGVESHPAISVSFTSNKKVDNAGTYIIPQSLTHDWGSFVCDFDRFDEELQSQAFRVLTYIGENDLQEEELAKKIKLMRRVLERVFPEILKADCTQSIRYSTEYGITGINDALNDDLLSENVIFIGHGASIEKTEKEDIHYLSRTITSLYQRVISL